MENSYIYIYIFQHCECIYIYTNKTVRAHKNRKKLDEAEGVIEIFASSGSAVAFENAAQARSGATWAFEVAAAVCVGAAWAF